MIRVFGTNMLAGKIFLFIGDILLMLMASVLAVSLRLGMPEMVEYVSLHLPSFTTQIVIYVACFYVGDLYDSKKDFRKLDNLMGIFAMCVVAMVFSILMFYSSLTYIGRGIFILYGALVLSFTMALRLIYVWNRSSHAFVRRILIIGAGRAGHSLMRAIMRHENTGLEVVGFIDDDPGKQGASVYDSKVVGNSKDLLNLVRELRIDMLVLSIAHKKNEELLKMLLKCHYNSIRVTDMLNVYEGITGKLPVSQISSEWLLLSAMSKQRLVYGKVKRLLDIISAVILTLVTLPVQVAAAIALWLESGGPVIYSQERLGLDYNNFRLYKFRTMVHDAEKECGAVWSEACDTRVTKVGRMLRKLRVDELPQLYNVLMGDMSFVGPRPEREVFVKELEKELPSYGHRLVVKPGLTGWAQVMHGYAASVDESREKLRYDLYYVKNMSLILDLLIILRTIKVVLMFKGH